MCHPHTSPLGHCLAHPEGRCKFSGSREHPPALGPGGPLPCWTYGAAGTHRRGHWIPCPSSITPRQGLLYSEAPPNQRDPHFPSGAPPPGEVRRLRQDPMATRWRCQPGSNGGRGRRLGLFGEERWPAPAGEGLALPPGSPLTRFL